MLSIVIMAIAIPKNNREFYKIFNDESLSAQFLREQNLVKRSDQKQKS
jgi:hypothetical protein